MISEKCFTSDWITEQRSKGLSANRPIIEKSIRALALLSHLAESGLDFVFKGGTSLLLHLNPIRRLSIDIDIMGAIPRVALENELRRIAFLPPFVGFSEDDRGVRGLPQRLHFRFNYPAIEKGDPQTFILLDIHSIRYDPSRAGELTQKSLAGNYSPLVKLRSVNPESFHYWTVVQDVLGSGDE